MAGNEDATTSSFVYNLPPDANTQVGGTGGMRLFNLAEGTGPLTYLKSILTDSSKFLTEVEGAAVLLDSQFQGIVNTMGQGQNMAQSIKMELSEASIEILKMGGDVTDAAKIQTTTIESLGRNVVLSSQEMSQFYNLSRATGVELKTLQEGFADIGVSIHNIDDEMVKVIDVANSLGVSTKAVSKSVVDNLYQLNRFNFKDGIEGLAKMAAKASILRFDMSKTFEFADKMLDPSAAIDASAALQRLGATASSLTDPLQLMNLSQNNVPELQKQLGDLFKSYTQFDEKTGKFEIMPGARKQLKEVSLALGMDVKEVEKLALGTADLDKKLSEIDFSGFSVEDETKELIASMATMKGGDYVVKIEDEQGKQQEKTINELISQYQDQPDKLKEILQAQQDKEAESPEEKMLSIANAQKDILTDIRSNTKAGAASITLTAGATVGQDMLKLNQEIANVQSKAIQENFGPGSEYAKGLESASKDLKGAAEDIKAGNYEQAAIKFGQAVTDFTTGAGISVAKTATDITTEMGDLLGAQTELTKTMDKYTQQGKDILTKLSNIVGIQTQDAIVDPGSSILTMGPGEALTRLLPSPNDILTLIDKKEIINKQEELFGSITNKVQTSENVKELNISKFFSENEKEKITPLDTSLISKLLPEQIKIFEDLIKKASQFEGKEIAGEPKSVDVNVNFNKEEKYPKNEPILREEISNSQKKLYQEQEPQQNITDITKINKELATNIFNYVNSVEEKPKPEDNRLITANKELGLTKILQSNIKETNVSAKDIINNDFFEKNKKELSYEKLSKKESEIEKIQGFLKEYSVENKTTQKQVIEGGAPISMTIVHEFKGLPKDINTQELKNMLGTDNQLQQKITEVVNKVLLTQTSKNNSYPVIPKR